MIKQTLIAVLTAALLPTIPVTALAQSGDDWSAIEAERWAQAEKVLAKIRSQFRAKVREVAPQPDGTTRVLFYATERYEKDSDKIAEKVSKEFALIWSDRDRPIPWVAQQQVDLGTKDSEPLYVNMGTVMPQYFRYGTDREVELLVRDEKQKPFLIRPHKLGSMTDYGIGLDWIKGPGVVMTNSEAGSGEFEIEGSSRAGAGITPANAPGRRVLLGRDGWRTIESVQPEGEPREGYSGYCRKLIPASQRIWCAG